jgi:hypothetical protein
MGRVRFLILFIVSSMACAADRTANFTNGSSSVVQCIEAALDPLKWTLDSRKGGGFTQGHWERDEYGDLWFVKRDAVYPDLQTSAEVISARIYRFFGYQTPETIKFVRDGVPYSASKYIGDNLKPANLYDMNTSQVRKMRVVAAYLKDWDRLGNLENTLRTPGHELYLIDFGGTLGSSARGRHKPGHVLHKEIGVFEPTTDIATIYDRFYVEASPKHPWNLITRSDAEELVTQFKGLTNNDIETIVEEAHYQNPSARKYMIEALELRRDGIIKSLLTRFSSDEPADVPKLRRQALKWMNEQSQRVERVISSMGYSSIDELKAAVATSGVRGREAVRALEDPSQIEFVIHRPSLARTDILKNGFQNFHETGVTQGAAANLAKGVTSDRNRIEAYYAGMSSEQYDRLNPRRKPLYGLLSSSPSSGHGPQIAAGYGDDRFIFKKDAITDYITLYAGDSLDFWRDQNGNKYGQGPAMPQVSWDQFVIPWRDRMILAPFVDFDQTDTYSKSLMGIDYNATPSIPVKRVFPGNRSVENIKLDGYRDYLEWQLWKPESTLNDIEGFEFSRFPPAGAFLKELKNKHIKIYDQRRSSIYAPLVWPRKVWDGTYGPSFIEMTSDRSRSVAGYLNPQVQMIPLGEGPDGGKWFQDEGGVRWLEQLDLNQVRSGAEVISSNLYRAAGYPAPHRLIATSSGDRFLLSWFPGEGPHPDEELAATHISNSKYRQLLVFAALLDDPKIAHMDPSHAFSDYRFGGSLGTLSLDSAPRGGGGSPRLGSIAPVDSVAKMMSAMNLDKLPKDHPWLHLEKGDVAAAIEGLRSLDDDVLKKAVDAAFYNYNSNEGKEGYLPSIVSDETAVNYLYNTLRQRRDILIQGLNEYFEIQHNFQAR